MRLVSWNIRQLDEAWRILEADEAIDIALLQEAKPPPASASRCDVVPLRDADWKMLGYERVFRTAVARLSDRVTMQARPMADIHSAGGKAMSVSRAGTVTAVDVAYGSEVFTCISAYSVWETVITEATKPWIIADASAHRILSDISTLIATQDGDRIILAGDFNLMRGHGEQGSEYWAKRYATFFARAEALGLRCVGPAFPNGHRAHPWPRELPTDSTNVPTFRWNQRDPATATRQLDYVFASESIADRVTVTAKNGVDEWGPSDHCKIVIDVAARSSSAT